MLLRPTVLERNPTQIQVVLPPCYAALWFPALFVVGGIVGLVFGGPSFWLFLLVTLGLTLGAVFSGCHATIVADDDGIRADNRFLRMGLNDIVVPLGEALTIRHQAGMSLLPDSIQTPWKLVVVLKDGDIEYLAGGSSRGGEQSWALVAAALNDVLRIHSRMLPAAKAPAPPAVAAS